MSATYKVGPAQQIKTIDGLRAVMRQIADGSMILFESGQTFAFDQGLDLSGKKNLTLSAFGPGLKLPQFVFEGAPKNVAGVARSPVAITAAGSGHSISDLEFAPGTLVSEGDFGVVAVNVTGSGVTIDGLSVLAGCYKAIGAFAAINVAIKRVVARAVQYGVHGVKGNGDENVAPHCRGLEITACDMEAIEHVVRFDAVDGGHIHHNVCLDGSHARCCITVHSLSNVIVENNPKLLGNIGGGPLAQGQYDVKPPGPNKDYCMKMQLRGFVFRKNTGVLANDAGITLDMGVVDALIDSNTITSPCATVFNFNYQDRYAMRGPIGAKITNNIITRKVINPMPPLLKGNTSHVVHSGNTDNGKKVD